MGGLYFQFSSMHYVILEREKLSQKRWLRESHSQYKKKQKISTRGLPNLYIPSRIGQRNKSSEEVNDETYSKNPVAA